MPKIGFALGLIILLGYSTLAQYPKNPISPSSESERLTAVEQRKSLTENSPYLGIKAANIGPTIMSGRVVDMAINPYNPKHFFVAYATGGVWETKNNGQSFIPIFDNNGFTIHCGALAVNWVEKIIYVGTGEANSSRSSYAGFGLFKCDFSSNDSNNWNNWEHLGLAPTQHISRIILHPTNNRILYVAAMGNLFSPNKDRGVFKTTNGGETWQRILFIDENTSAVDLEIDPKNSDRLFAAMWQKSRRAWNFWEGGENSGIHISNDGGSTWNKSESFPSGKHIGRIGLTISKNSIYALLDNQETHEKETKLAEGLTKNSFKTMSLDSFQNISDSLLNRFLKTNRFPSKYKAKDIQKMVKKENLKPYDLFEYLYDENAAMFDDPVKGAELYRSIDNGKTWVKTHNKILENICYSYGYYFGVVTVNPSNSENVFIAGVPLLKSSDGGRNFTFIGGDNVHVDHHFIWVNPRDSLHLINGNDGGINISYDGGRNWTKCNSPAVGQFYTVAVDNQKNYNVYGGLQDNGVWKGPNTYKHSSKWHQEGKYPYQRLGGGDGMQIQVDSRDNTVYTGSQFGHYYRIDPDGKYNYFHPMHDLKSEKLRWNWQTPILLSSHNQDILYMASNKVHRSMNQGKTFEEISPDLSNGKKSGDVSYGTISCISESPYKFGHIYAGTDDGNIQLTKNGGESWSKISTDLPQNLWAKEVIASQHMKNRVYAVLNGHTWDHFKSYIFVSENNGETWVQLGKNLPQESINTIVEDHTNEDILYIGTDAGVYVSIDQGNNFKTLGDLPPVAVHDMVIQKENRDLIIGTHGRSIYKIQLEPIYQSATYKDSSFVFLEMDVLKYNENWGTLRYDWSVITPTKDLVFFLPKTSNNITLYLTDSKDNLLFSKEISGVKGYNNYKLSLLFDTNESGDLIKGALSHYHLPKGRYTIRLESGFTNKFRTLIIQ